MAHPEVVNRRQLKTRARAWPSAIARMLARARLTPNMVSVLSVLFAAAAGLNFWAAGVPFMPQRWRWLLTAAVCIQIRLLCNLLDGLLAIEGGLKAKTGDLYNEIPDRLGDIAILVGAGYAVRAMPFGVALGWSAALVAVLTAYIRLLGGSLGFVQDFSGPMAKQHRMFALTVGTVGAAIEVGMRGTLWSVYVALWIILAGAMFTATRRTVRIARALENR